MELLVVDFGDSYDRSVVGVARDLAEARVMARAYVTSVCWGQVVQEFQYFAVQRHRLGELTTGYVEDEALDLGEHVFVNRGVTQVWTIREVGSNGFLGTYRTYTADQAIQKFWDDQAATAATFRRSQPLRKFAVTATVEPVD